MAKTRLILGVMSGSSLDGLDMALCRFSADGDQLDYEVRATGQATYDDEWLERLRQVHRVDLSTYFTWNYDYGVWLGKKLQTLPLHQRLLRIWCLSMAIR